MPETRGNEKRNPHKNRPPLALTEAAAQAVKEAMDIEGVPGQGIRIAIIPGICSQTRYEIEILPSPRPGDVPGESRGIRLFLDPASEPYLRGMVLDHIHGLHTSGFRFVTASEPGSSES